MNTLTVFFIITTGQFNLPPDLLRSLCYVESHHDITAVHHDDGNGDSLGVCQIKIKTAKLMGFKGTEKELMNPETNIYYAGKYLSHQVNRYQGSVKKAVIAYNIGSARDLTSSRYQRKVYSEWRRDVQNERFSVRTNR